MLPVVYSKLPFIFIEIQQPGDKGEFHIQVFDGKTRTRITENRLKEDRSYLEYIYTSRLLENGLIPPREQNPDFDQQAKNRYDDLVRYGQMLYRDIFGKNDAFKKYIAKQPHLQGGAQLILRLHSTASELWNTPWEYMHDGTNFLGIQPQFPITRTLMTSKLDRPDLDLKQLPCPLRILMVLSHPKDAMPLNVDTEIAMIRRAVRDAEEAGRIEIDFVEEGTLENLERALTENDYHILHYSGHGSVAPQGSFLVMEDEAGMSRPVFLRQLLPVLQQSKSLRFVFLSACKAGTITATQATSGIATGLLQVTPAVLAMQFSVQDRSASLLAEAFYGSLGRGRTIEEAMHQARFALHKINPMFGDWGVPALYTHSPNLRMLDTKSAPVSTATRQRFDLSALPSADPFVGRHNELRTLRAALPNKEIRSVYLWGMAGIGKSALIRQMMERSGQRDLLADVLVVRCTGLKLSQVIERIHQWLLQHFPQAAVLTDSKLNPIQRLEAAASLIRGKRLLLVLDGIDQLMTPQADRHGDFQHPQISQYFQTLATAEWDVLTIFTSRLRWAKLQDLPSEHCLEVHLGSLLFTDILFLLQNLEHLKSVDVKDINTFFERTGGHPLTMHYINAFLGKKPQHNPLQNPQLPAQLAKWWTNTFLGAALEQLSPKERQALSLLSVHGDAFDPEFVQVLVDLPSVDEAIELMVSWEALSLVYFQDTDSEETPWYIVPNLVQTAVTAQMTPETLQKSHAEVARVMQRRFFLNAERRYKHIKGPKPDHMDQFQSILTDVAVMTKRMIAPAASRYLQMVFTWHAHLREAKQDDRANEIAMTLLPVLWSLKARGLSKELIAILLEKTSEKSAFYATARLWEASHALEAGQNEKALESLQIAEKLAHQLKLTAMFPQILERRGEIFRNQGNHAEAKRAWQAALQLHIKADHAVGMSQCLLYLGENAYFHGDHLHAVQFLEQALNRLSKTDQLSVDLRIVGQLLLYRAHIYRKIKNDAAALEVYSDALGLGRQVGDGFIIAKGLEGVGYTYGLLGQYDIAAKYLLQAVDLYEKIDDKRSLAVAQTRLAQVYDYKGNTAEARVFCERALQLAAQHAPSAVKQTEDLLKVLKSKWRRLLINPLKI